MRVGPDNGGPSEVIPADNSPRPDKTSVLLNRLVSELDGERVTVDHIVRELRRRSFGGLFILLAAFGLLPGLSFFAGLAMLLPAVQMVLGFRAPRLPGFIRRRELDVSGFSTLVRRIIPWVERLERFVKPRWLWLTLLPVPNLIGVAVIGLALVIMLPLPFSNLPPAIAMFCLSIGLLERDGMMIAIGLLVGLLAFVVGAVMAVVAFESLVPVLSGYLR